MMEQVDGRFRGGNQIFVRATGHSFVFFRCREEPASAAAIEHIGVWSLRRTPMDWRMAMVRTEPPAITREDEVGYAAGWTISGLATLGTIVVVWIFAL